MKGYFAIAAFVCCNFFLAAQTDHASFPKYKEFISFFFKTYSIENCDENTSFKFEKHPDGWHVSIYSEEGTGPALKDVLLWDLKTKAYREIPFIRKKELEDNDAQRDRFLEDQEAPHFDACPYYGYKSWHWDVIRDYDKAGELPDTVLYGLGRAYSACAGNLLNENANFSDETQLLALKDGKNSMTPEQLEKYRYYRHKAIDAYKKVCKSNPDFETMIGTIRLKLSHEYVSTFLELRIYQNEQEALKELPENAYNDFFISLAKNYLTCCDKNAILFVNGDSDTYPLLYVQAKYNFRPDVMVVNTSLLQTERYINHLREKILEAEPLVFTHAPEDIKGKKREYILLAKDSVKVRDLAKVIKFIKNDKNKVIIEDSGYYMCAGSMLKTKIDNKPIQWRLPFHGYFFRNALMMLDLVSNYSETRPLYFAQTLESTSYLGLTNYLDYAGLVYKLGNRDFTETSTKYEQVNGPLLYKRLMQEYSWKGAEQITPLDKLFLGNYANQFYLLTMKFIEQKENEKAKEVLDQYFRIFPDNVYPYDYITLSLMECYYQIRETNKANEIGKAVLLNMKNRRINVPTLFNVFSEKTYNEATLKVLKKQVKTYRQDEFFNKLWD